MTAKETLSDLFGPKPEVQRAPRQHRMHVWDAGDSGDNELPIMCVFHCGRCGGSSEWTKVKSVTEAKRGIPCPTCNDRGDIKTIEK